jgi:hypothetical protein
VCGKLEPRQSDTSCIDGDDRWRINVDQSLETDNIEESMGVKSCRHGLDRRLRQHRVAGDLAG